VEVEKAGSTCVKRIPASPCSGNELRNATKFDGFVVAIKIIHYSDKSGYLELPFAIGLRTFVLSEEMPCLARQSAMSSDSLIWDWKKLRWHVLPSV
jgi:hypothetical protein